MSTTPPPSGAGIRRSALLTVGVLWVVVVALAVAALRSEEHGSGLVGMALLWGFMALGASALTIAVERRRRASDRAAGTTDGEKT